MAAKAAKSVVRLGQEKPVYAVLMSVFPRLMNVREDRELLGLVRSYGEVVSFFNLKNRWPVPAPNRYLAIFKDPGDASNFMRNSPIEFNFIHPIDTQDNLLAKIITEKANELGAGGMAENEPENASSHPGAPSKYTLKSTLAIENHMQTLKRHPYWGGFNPASRKAEFEDLIQLVPNLGLADVTSLRGPDVASKKVEHRQFHINKRKRLRDIIAEMDGSQTKTLGKRNEEQLQTKKGQVENSDMVD